MPHQLKDWDKKPFDKALNLMENTDTQPEKEEWMETSIEVQRQMVIRGMSESDAYYIVTELSKVISQMLATAEALGREKERGETCAFCSTDRKIASDGTRYLCNHFSEYCKECLEWRSLSSKE